jgi:hypothetical protein
MPKRLIDDSLLTSPSLAKCSPRAQDAFPRFILMADDFGCFEAFPRVLVAKGWPYRSDVAEADVWSFLEEYVAAGMACLWTEKERRWCFLTGWFGSHGQKKRAEYDPNAPAGTPGRHGSKRKTPVPPADLVAAVVAGERRVHDGKPPGVDRETTGNEESEIPNNSVPAREMTVSRPVPAAVPEFPGPAVPVAVAVPVARSHPPARARLVSPFGAADPHPLTTAALAALYDRGLDAAPPGSNSADRVEAAIKASGLEAAVERLAAVYSDPSAKRPLTYHVDAIRGAKLPRAPDDRRWQDRLTPDEFHRAHAELRALHPDLADAPLGCIGDPLIHPVDAIAAVNEKYRAIAEARS